MGVFAMFRRKKQDAVETSAEETGAGTEAGADLTAEAPKAPVENGAGVAEGAEGTDRADGAEDVETGEVTAGAAAEAVEIPRQQSAEAAADNEAGDGARR
ncbi:hypothetical protein [Streptomyces sp. NPDC057494]|uniref:hypothetical protein n=1 Tax=Streptomyces sp. NPDC057494 TaxID=3346148 RepID=UPI003677DD27